MLASITPLGERGRRQRWAFTVVAFLLGASLAAASLGAALGGLGSLIPSGIGMRGRLAMLAFSGFAALLVDLGAPRVPGPRRQVDRQWLDAFRGWVYGAGFGAQLGVGVVTVVTSGATYLALLVAVLSGSPGRGALILAVYGAGRGVQPLLAARVSHPAALVSLHRQLEDSAAAARALTLAALAALSTASLWSALA